MKSQAVTLACLLVTGAAFAQPSAAPQIETTFPTAGELRRPDRTLAPASAGPVSAIAYTPDGRMLAAAGHDNVIVLRDARTGEQGTGDVIRAFEGHRGKILALAFSTDGKTMVSVGEDHRVRSWEVAAGKLLRETDLKSDRTWTAVAVRPGDQPLLAATDGAEVCAWNYQTEDKVRTFSAQKSAVHALGFSPDGRKLAAGFDDGAVRIWDVETGALAQTVDAGAPVLCMALSASDVVAGMADGGVTLWTGDGLTRQRKLRAHSGAVRAVSFSPKGEQAASAGQDGNVNVWDVATGIHLCSQRGHTHEVTVVAMNPNGQKMASADLAGELSYWTVPLSPLTAADLDKIAAAVPAKATAAPKKPRRLLVFWRADAILHKGGVPAANHAIEWMGRKTGAYEADFSRDYAALDPKVLKNYDAIVLNSTAHLVIPESAKKALLEFAQRGGGVIGIHAAIDTFKGWPEGTEIIGATFGGHPWGPSGTWAVKLEEPEHPLLRAWAGKNFKIRDEFYEMAEPYRRSDRRVLMTADMSDPATAGVKPLFRKDGDFALSWIKRCGEGRVFYCVFGHIVEPFQNPAVLQYYLDGIQFALGDLEVDASPLPAAKP
jgi:WD40 repeat protein